MRRDKLRITGALAIAALASGCGGDDVSATGGATAAQTTWEGTTSSTTFDSLSGTETDTDTDMDEGTDTEPESETTGLSPDCSGFGVAADMETLGRVICCHPALGDDMLPEVATTTLSGVVTIDGETPIDASYDSGLLFLEETTTGDRVLLGSTAAQAYAVAVFPGRYRVVYEVDQAQMKVPINTRAVIEAEVYIPPGEWKRDIDVKTVALSGALLVDGAPPVKSLYDAGELYLYDAQTESRTRILNTAKANVIVARVVAGSYELRYAAAETGAKMPRNGDAILGEVEIPAQAEYSLGDVAVKTVTLDAGIAVDGQPPPPSAIDNAAIFLHDTATSDRIFVGETMNGQLGARVIDGPWQSYELRYAALKTQSLPINEWSLIAADVEVAALPGMIELPTATVSASIDIDGGPAPVGEPEESALLSLAQGGDRAVLGATKDGPVSRRVLALAPYDLIYGHEASGGAVPANVQARIEAGYAAGDELAVNVETTLLSGAITVGGMTPPASVYDNGRLFLRSKDGDGDVVALGETRFGGFERRVVNKVYEVVYSVETAGGKVPSNVDYVIQEIDLSAAPSPTVSLDIDVPAEPFNVTLSFDVTAKAFERGRILVRNVDSEELFYVGEISGSNAAYLSGTLIPGTYAIYYQADRGGSGIPANQRAMISCVTVGL
ncbi:MAG: hypothetical protein R3A79_11280 [Nannocystaceae bacterium]